MTRLALNLCGYVNGVAERHAATAHRMFPGFRVHAITNGVHAPTWTCPSFARLYQANFPHWQHEPEVLVRADQLADEPVWEAHAERQAGAAGRDRGAAAGSRCDPELPLLGFARRMTGYKRPELLFTDLERLRRIAQRWPFQVVMAGKAHPRDGDGKNLIERMRRDIRQLAGAVPAAFLPNYDMALAPPSGCRRRRLAEHAVAAARSVRHQRHEGGAERRPELQRARRLVGRSLDRGAHRLGDRRWPVRRP